MNCRIASDFDSRISRAHSAPFFVLQEYAGQSLKNYLVKQASNRDILIDLFPMNANPLPDESPVGTLGR
jgi:hypothetical protein